MCNVQQVTDTEFNEVCGIKSISISTIINGLGFPAIKNPRNEKTQHVLVLHFDIR